MKRLLPVGLAISLPCGILGWLLMRHFFGVMYDISSLSGGGFGPEALTEMLWAMSSIFGFLVVFLAGETLLYVAFTLIYAGETVGRHYETSEVFSLTLSGRGVRAIVQRTLALFAASLIYIVPYALVGVLAGTEMGALLVIVSLLFPILGFAFFIYLLVRWAFGLVVITWEQEGIIESFRRSADLVHGNGWRVFGILAFFSILSGLALSIVLSPLQFIVMWDFFKAYIDMIQVLAVDPEAADPLALFEVFRSLGFGFALLISLNLMLKVLLKAAYLTTLYFDLRARNYEFGDGVVDSI